MSTIDQQIDDILKEIRKTPYHKGTERHLGLLKAKVSKLKAKREAATARGSSDRGISYAVKKQGDATIVLVGPPSVGKSTLLNQLTNAKSKIAPYAFTTVSVIPGMMEYQDARIQILDVPGLIAGAEEGKGRGREVLAVIRGADLIILLVDPDHLSFLKRVDKSLEKNGIRLNKIPPKVSIKKKLKGGIIVHTNIKQDLDLETIKAVSSESGFKNVEININENLTLETLIDAFTKSRVYIQTIEVVNKIDLNKKKSPNPKLIKISAEKKIGLKNLKKEIWKKLDLVRIYLIKTDQKPNKENPIIMHKGDKLNDVLSKLGSDMMEIKTKAKIWGPGAKYPGQVVSLTTPIQKGIQVRFI